jgi:hypothetical protein
MMTHFPAPPPGYTLSLVIRRIVATHPTEPVLYLDEETMTWRELTTHISEVPRAVPH